MQLDIHSLERNAAIPRMRRAHSAPPSLMSSPSVDDGASEETTQPTHPDDQAIPFAATREHLILEADGTVRTDAVVTVDQETMERIASGQKTHEFRPFRIDARVKYLWIYVKIPVGAIT